MVTLPTSNKPKQKEDYGLATSILAGVGSGGASFCTAIAQGSENVFAG